ncbi:MAG: hypothetical protein JST80_08665 [Bdellovibrionales bacterium]|nr:hypothetical protein [Bdellovibrionales bacterium]
MKNIDILELEKLAPGPEIDYPSIIQFLGQYYEAPMRKLQELQKQKYLLRLKKGFYVFNPQKFARAYRSEIVSNLLYGPSYLSLEYALAHYGLIPERVEERTSVTLSKNKVYRTQIGTFSYQHLSADLYPLLIKPETMEGGGSYLIASPEKAILDFLTLKTKDDELATADDLKEFLKQDLRLDTDRLESIASQESLESVLPFYVRRKRCRLMIELLLGGKK